MPKSAISLFFFTWVNKEPKVNCCYTMGDPGDLRQQGWTKVAWTGKAKQEKKKSCLLQRDSALRLSSFFFSYLCLLYQISESNSCWKSAREESARTWTTVLASNDFDRFKLDSQPDLEQVAARKNHGDEASATGARRAKQVRGARERG